MDYPLKKGERNLVLPESVRITREKDHIPGLTKIDLQFCFKFGGNISPSSNKKIKNRACNSERGEYEDCQRSEAENSSTMVSAWTAEEASFITLPPPQ